MLGLILGAKSMETNNVEKTLALKSKTETRWTNKYIDEQIN